MATPAVRSASAAPSFDLAPHLPRALPSPLGELSLLLAPASALSPRTKAALYALFDKNMAPLAAGTSMAHDRAAKLAEMFDPDARYLLLARAGRMPGAMPRVSRRRQEDVDVSDELVGFASFRFDTEDTMGADDVEVVYCYELQLTERARGAGLGALLMAELEGIGAKRGMAKAMLTCLANNTAALAFYAKAGYTPDEIDPTRIAEEGGWEDVDSDGEQRRPDYRILSKLL
ncbi:acyl-CoA N-acyltransferase [Cutaneotrichosporon oleaginosum]|uniref:N-alpha-acetyltransferase 40 n=1 Tax=Cutaneotrichosporon oleaginosum TaxID=879819 RepID=A0A0J0XHG7_9TREE|nr:acyl-CoA N-acyltransferase [Cutaneotrichosporon oleaginosum]KLT40452.1 acyl-CoA N-acyltransferase [Cutaneotrichosporon oleaginosum]TXT15355.1 hypothetical protein COLE_01548 [Cutaneotrichosporon oleaginosum]